MQTDLPEAARTSTSVSGKPFSVSRRMRSVPSAGIGTGTNGSSATVGGAVVEPNKLERNCVEGD
ncbi:MAG: hypothetical protein JWR21_2130 [Herminiimonas sp.]|nr:hypothetical protein [Herminiimonas sp.]